MWDWIPPGSGCSTSVREAKGRSLEKTAFTMLEAAPINFVGNIEGRDLAAGKADVIVTDRFTGNVLLKTAEGAAG